MPIPTRNKDESKEDFLKRCMGDPNMQEYPEDQRFKICQRQLLLSDDERWSEKDFALAGKYLLGGEARITSDFQLIMPIGLLHTRQYGDIDLSPNLAAKIVENYNAKVMGERRPFIDTDHDFGVANGWIEELQLRDDGIYGRIKWTELGEKNVGGELYKYFSPCIDKYMNTQTGETIYPVLKAVSLTNVPVADSMPPARLSDKGSHGEAEKNPKEGNMTYQELLKVIGEMKKDLKPEELTALSEALGIEKQKEPEKKPDEKKPEEPVTELSESATNKVIAQLSETVNVLQKDLLEMKSKEAAKGENEFIKMNLAEGKIVPADEEFWRGQYRANPTGAAAILEKLPKRIDFSQRGSGAGGGEKQPMTPDERRAAEKYGMTKEQIEALDE